MAPGRACITHGWADGALLHIDQERPVVALSARTTIAIALGRRAERSGVTLMPAARDRANIDGHDGAPLHIDQGRPAVIRQM